MKPYILLIMIFSLLLNNPIKYKVLALEGDTVLINKEHLEQVDTKRNGTISIHLSDTSQNNLKSNVVFGITKIADVQDGNYKLRSDLKQTNIDLNKINSASELQEISEILKKNIQQYENISKTDEQGYAAFHNLSIGVYLIWVVDIAKYEEIAPFIVAIPNYDMVLNELCYDIIVKPKHTPHPTISIQKVDATDNKPLKNAKFTLFDCDGHEISNVTTNEDGVANFYNIKNGTYYLKEIEAPNGYKLNNQEIEIQINEQLGINNTYELKILNERFHQNTTGDREQPILYFIAMISTFVICVLINLKKHTSIFKNLKKGERAQ